MVQSQNDFKWKKKVTKARSPEIITSLLIFFYLLERIILLLTLNHTTM